MVRKAERASQPKVRFRQFWGATKRADLLSSLSDPIIDSRYEPATPEKSNRYSFRPVATTSEYLSWPKWVELCALPPFNGPIERRGNSLIVFGTDKAQLALLESYLDPHISDGEVQAFAYRLMKSSGEFKAEITRASLKGRVKYSQDNIARYPFKPFDVRLAYLSGEIQPLFSRPSPELLALRDIPNQFFFLTRDSADKLPEGPPFYFARLVCDYDCISGHARHFPVFMRAKPPKANSAQASLLPEAESVANLSPPARFYLTALGLPNPDTDPNTATLIWMHALAIGYSPAYLRENTDGIRGDWPRVPLPNTKAVLLASGALGKQIATLLDTESPVVGVTTGAIRPELKRIAVVERVGGHDASLNLAVTAGWGSAGKDGVTMPGKGKRVGRAPNADEGITGLGNSTHDVYLNNDTYWRNVPARVWEYTIGGYQVIKKWLSYREEKLLGRPISHDEAREARDIARRIAAILLLEPELDANYEAVKSVVYPWPQTD